MSLIHAGFAKIEITPPLERMETFGIGYWYARSVRFTGVRDPLFVRTLALGDSTNRQIVVSVDSILDSYGFIPDATSRIASALQISEKNIFITCTHTHSSPLIEKNDTYCGKEYGAYVADRILIAAITAAESTEEATASISQDRIENVLYNRRPLLRNGRVAELHGATDPADVIDAGAINNTMTLISFHRANGNRIGALCHFGIHGVSVQCSDLISSDCFGRAVQAIEAENEGDSFVLLHLNGACGDIDPIAMGDDDALDVMTDRLASGIRHVMFKDGRVLEDFSPFMAAQTTLRVRRRAARADMSSAASSSNPGLNENAPRHHSGSGYEAFLLSEEAKVSALPAELEISYQLLRWGQIVLVGVGGEVFTRSALSLQTLLPELIVLPVGLTGGAAGYLPTRDMYEQGGYEVACARWCPIALGETEKLFERITADLSEVGKVSAA